MVAAAASSVASRATLHAIARTLTPRAAVGVEVAAVDAAAAVARLTLAAAAGGAPQAMTAEDGAAGTLPLPLRTRLRGVRVLVRVRAAVAASAARLPPTPTVNPLAGRLEETRVLLPLTPSRPRTRVGIQIQPRCQPRKRPRRRCPLPWRPLRKSKQCSRVGTAGAHQQQQEVGVGTAGTVLRT